MNSLYFKLTHPEDHLHKFDFSKLNCASDYYYQIHDLIHSVALCLSCNLNAMSVPFADSKCYYQPNY